MVSFIGKSGSRKTSGGWAECVSWGIEQVTDDISAIVKIYKVRAGEPLARVIAEITADGVLLIEGGRSISNRHLLER